MAVKTFNPITPGLRFRVAVKKDELTKGAKPEKSLLTTIGSTGGRNSDGHRTMRHRGGGHKRRYRIVDFKRDKDGVPATVLSIQYDPNRSAHLALVQYADGEKRYIISPVGLKVGDVVVAGPDAPIRTGNALPLRNIPVGSQVHNIELRKGGGGQLARSAGSSAQLMGKQENYAVLRMPSGEVRRVHIECMATLGQVGNVDHENVVIGKAGRNRHKGKRPTVRGSVMSARTGSARRSSMASDPCMRRG